MATSAGRRCQEPIRDEVFPVGAVGVTAVVLAPRELAVEQPHVHARHLLDVVVVGLTEIFGTKQAKDRLRRNRRHVAALMVEPLGISLFGDAVTDERQTRRAQCNQFMCVDWNIAGVLAANDASDAPY